MRFPGCTYDACHVRLLSQGGSSSMIIIMTVRVGFAVVGK